MRESLVSAKIFFSPDGKAQGGEAPEQKEKTHTITVTGEQLLRLTSAVLQLDREIAHYRSFIDTPETKNLITSTVGQFEILHNTGLHLNRARERLGSIVNELFNGGIVTVVPIKQGDAPVMEAVLKLVSPPDTRLTALEFNAFVIALYPTTSDDPESFHRDKKADLFNAFGKGEPMTFHRPRVRI